MLIKGFQVLVRRGSVLRLLSSTFSLHFAKSSILEAIRILKLLNLIPQKLRLLSNSARQATGLLHVRLFVAQVYMKQRWCDGIKKKHHCLRITYVSVNIILISFQWKLFGCSYPRKSSSSVKLGLEYQKHTRQFVFRNIYLSTYLSLSIIHI